MSPVDGWWLTVRGKGDRIRQMPVSPDSLARLQDYLRAPGLAADPGTLSTAALVGGGSAGKVRAGRRCLGSGAVYHGRQLPPAALELFYALRKASAGKRSGGGAPAWS